MFRQLDSDVVVAWTAAEGAELTPGLAFGSVSGPLRSLLGGERTALNLLQHCSGVATLTRRYVRSTHGRAQIRDTRKTTPGLRALEKYAVRCGGGVNHRMSLSDAALIKDNHVRLAGGIAAAVAACRASRPDLTLEIEAQSLVDYVRAELFETPFSVALDVHSGFGMTDRLWYPFARSREVFPRATQVLAMKRLLDRTLPYHVYRFEPQSSVYTTHGDLWDHLFDLHQERWAASDPGRVFLPLTLEMAWSPQDPQRAFELLSLHPSIVPGDAAHGQR